MRGAPATSLETIYVTPTGHCQAARSTQAINSKQIAESTWPSSTKLNSWRSPKELLQDADLILGLHLATIRSSADPVTTASDRRRQVAPPDSDGRGCWQQA